MKTDTNDNKKNIEDIFGERLKKKREEKGLSQAQLAMLVWPEAEEQADTKRKCIVGYENGSFPKDPDIYLKLCSALGCDMGYLFGEHECSTKDVQGISDFLGLSEASIEKLHERHQRNNPFSEFCGDMVSVIIEDREFLLKCFQWIDSYYNLPEEDKSFMVGDENRPYFLLGLEDMKETIMIGLQNEIMKFIQRTYSIE